MKKIADLNTYHSKKMLLGEAEKLVDYIFEQAKQGKATHQVEQGIFDRLLTMGHLALGQFIALQGDGDLGKQIELPSGKTVKRLPRPQKRATVQSLGFMSWCVSFMAAEKVRRSSSSP